MYADTITASMQQTIDETNRRRAKQIAYNEAHGITPKQIEKDINRRTVKAHSNLDVLQGMEKPSKGNALSIAPKPYEEPTNLDYAMAADPIIKKMTPEQIRKAIETSTEKMKEAAKNLDFLLAAQYRDEVVEFQRLLDEK